MKYTSQLDIDYLNLPSNQYLFLHSIGNPDQFMTSINISLAKLNLDAPFVEQCRRLGLATLSDVLDCRLETLIKEKDFTYIWYHDLLDLLKEHGLLSEFQQRQL